MSGEISDADAPNNDSALADPAVPDQAPPGTSPAVGCGLSFRMLQLILLICQTLILIIGAAFIDWWPSNINIYASHRDLEHLGATENESRVLQIWQSIYLALSLLCTFYGAGMQDRGWLMLSMFMNIGIMSLLPFRNGSKEMPFTFFIMIFAVVSVTISYELSERIQNQSLLDKNVEPGDVKRKILCFDLPDMSIYHMGVLQVLTSSLMIFGGLLWMLLQEAMITQPVRTNFSCHSWPGGNCGRYYAFKAQEYYVGRMTIAMCVAGGMGLVGGFMKHRFFIDLAMVLTIIPFTAIIENGIYTLGNSEDTRYMCSDSWWTETRLALFWGEEWDCATQETYHEISILFMIITSSVSLFHLWISFRFSEKIQSEGELDEKIPNMFERLCDWFIESKRLMKLILVLSLFIAIGGIVQIAYGADAASSTQEELNWTNVDMVVVLDSPSYIDAHYIYGVLAIISAIAIILFFWLKDRTILFLVFCLLVETHAIGFQSLIWHEIDLLYGIVEFASNNEMIYPVYINGEARDTVYGSVQVYYVFNIVIMIALFLTILTSEAIQDEKKEDVLKNPELPMGILD